MSGLAAVLAGRVAPGAYHWQSHLGVADVRHTVTHAGWSFGYLDGVGLGSADDLHSALASTLGFPAHYGRNLDALRDCLRDVDARTVVLWDDWGPFARDEPPTFEVAVGLLGERLPLLLRGHGPDVGVPLLG